MRSVEVTGKTKEEAVEEAARQLGVTPGDLTVELLDEPKKLLGLFAAHEVRIRASVAEEVDAANGTATQSAEVPAPAPAEDAAPAGTAADYACEVLDGILERMDLDATSAVVASGGDETCLEISGPDAHHVIGRHGETLNALQLIVSIMISRRFTDAGRIALDAEGYREQRQQMLQRMALQHAEKAKEAGKEIVIKDLKPYERRIVHLALRDDPEIETYSEGEGDDRYLVISPIVE